MLYSSFPGVFPPELSQPIVTFFHCDFFWTLTLGNGFVGDTCNNEK